MSRCQRNSSKIPVEIPTGIIIINYFFPYYFCCILQQKDTEDEGNNPVNNEYFVQIYNFSRILYCSKDPTTDSKTTNPNFNELFDQFYKSSLCYHYFRHKRTDRKIHENPRFKIQIFMKCSHKFFFLII